MSYRDDLDEFWAADPEDIVDPVERLKLIVAQWEMDEGLDLEQAFDYADKFLERLDQFGLTVQLKGPG